MKRQISQIIFKKFLGVFFILNGVGCALFCFYKIILLWGGGIFSIFMTGLLMLGGGMLLIKGTSSRMQPSSIISGIEERLKNIHLVTSPMKNPYKLLGIIMGIIFLGGIFCSRTDNK
jgi:hypothetical protein